MNNKRYSWGALVVILIIATFFRFWHMPSNPPSLNWDEVAFGYNAYSILKTGKDEFGTSFPLYFRSLDDYKLPVYTYLTVGSIAVFGYNDFSVRFPSAFLGVLTVGLVYFLVKELFNNGLPHFAKATRGRRIADFDEKKNANMESAMRNQSISQSIALLSAFFLAILPWHIQFSRMAAEANVGLFFLTLGVTLFLIGIRKHYVLLWCSMVAFGLATYSYLSFRVITPLIGLTLVFLFWKELFMLDKKKIVGLLIPILFVGGLLVHDTFFSGMHIRLRGTTIFARQDAVDIFKAKEDEMFYDAKLKINLTRRLFHDNTAFTTADIILKGYMTHFAPTFFFFDYDQKQHHTPFVGLCYIWMFPFIPLGWYFLIRHMQKREACFITAWFLIAPIPAAVTWDIPHAIRSLGFVIPVVILTACGVYYVLHYMSQKKMLQYGFGAILTGFIVLSSYYYFHQYMIHLPVERSKDWVYGRKEMTEYILANKDKYDKIIVSSALEWPYIFMLYYSTYDPATYLAQGGTVSGGWGEEKNAYDRYEFHTFRAEDMRLSKSLFVGLPKEFSDTVKPIHTINYLNGTPAIIMAEGDIKP